VAEYRITYWREIPSMVTARDGDGQTSKASLPPRFQEAIDEAAMRLDMAASDAYLEQWRLGDWLPADGSPDEIAETVAGRLDSEYDAHRLGELVDR
jgi:Virulence factor